MKNIVTNIIRRFLTGGKQKFVFSKSVADSFAIPKVEEMNLYIHIPFCKSMCPYCPYNRVRYEKHLIKRYFDALSKEIDIYSQKLGKIKINSIYIGGGTPTNAIDELAITVEKLQKTFNIVGDIAIETTVADITEENLNKMQNMGISMLSIGVQSFDDKYLKLLGRNYTADNIDTSFELIKKFNFQNVNVDLIFAFPNQTPEELLQDITKADRLGADQITAYPLFTFPYSTIGSYMKIKKIEMPNFFARRKFYKTIYNYFKKNNYEIASVWSFQKAKENQNYSSVTRNRYIGLGAGAGSRLENIFYFNTFSIHDYEHYLLDKGVLPVAIDMPITTKLSELYWFYWKLYEAKFSIHDFQKRFERHWKLKLLMKLFFLLGLCQKNNDEIILTERGSFWIHLAQNYFMLDYINKVWTRMKKDAFPEKIEI